MGSKSSYMQTLTVRDGLVHECECQDGRYRELFLTILCSLRQDGRFDVHDWRWDDHMVPREGNLCRGGNDNLFLLMALAFLGRRIFQPPRPSLDSSGCKPSQPRWFHRTVTRTCSARCRAPLTCRLCRITDETEAETFPAVAFAFLFHFGHGRFVMCP